MIKKGKFPDRTSYREFIPISLKRVINKALSVKPEERYQSAESMRHALEQVPLYINWNEQLLSNGFIWRTSHNGDAYDVKRVKNRENNWDVEVKKGKSSMQLRRINRLCLKGGTLKQAIQHTKTVLQDFVTGKET